MLSQLIFKPFKNQDYSKLRSECLRKGTLYEDDLFPPNNYSISRKSVIKEAIAWKRPHQIVNDPRFIIDSMNPSDFNQGQLSNW